MRNQFLKRGVVKGIRVIKEGRNPISTFISLRDFGETAGSSVVSLSKYFTSIKVIDCSCTSRISFVLTVR